MTKTIAIIDYGSGNIFSAAKAFSHVSNMEGLGYQVKIVESAKDVATADKIILPGQGAFGDCIQNLRAVPDMIDVLEEKVLRCGTPFFGICVGMQLLADVGYEFGTHKGLGWIPGEVLPLKQTRPDLKIPHMGWNEIIPDQPDHVLLRSIKSSSDYEKNFYFVHSFMVHCKKNEHLLAHTDYGQEVTAIIGRDNIFGTQFHPEKSQNAGLYLIKEFIAWTP